MKVKEVIQRVQSLYSKGVESDDSRLSSRHIYNKLLTTRNLLITQKIRKNQGINQSSYQSLDCLVLVETAKHDCPCIPPIGCMIYKVDRELPKAIMGFDDIIIDSVTSIDGEIDFNPTTWKDMKYEAAAKYTASLPLYFIKDNILYVSNKKRIQYITIRGLFEDPIAVNEFNKQCDTALPCCTECDETEEECISNLDLDFHIDGDLIEPLIQITVQELIGIFNKSREDITNDSRDSILPETK